ncbi:MAG: hcaF [Frankiales bacterium]|nr:hcaF [Frankiales bacterium]
MTGTARAELPAEVDLEVAPGLETEATRFLYREAAALDSGNFDAWLAMLAPDIQYQVPVRSTRYGRADEEFSATSFHFDEDLFSLTMRVKRLATRFAWAEDPPSRNRHMVTNVLVTAVSATGALKVSSNLLLTRSRFDESRTESLSGARSDVLERIDGRLRLARRTVFLDQTTLPVGSITTFL